MEDDVDELHHSDSSKAAVGASDKINNRKAGVFPLSKFVGLVEALGEGYHGEELVVQMRKL